MFKRCDYIPEMYGEKEVTFEGIIKYLNDLSGLNIQSKSRVKPLPYYRAMAYAAGRYLDFSYNHMGAIIGRDHSTVIVALQRVHFPYMEGYMNDRIMTNLEYKSKYYELIQWINSKANKRTWNVQPCTIND